MGQPHGNMKPTKGHAATNKSKKGAQQMPTKEEILVVQKSTVYDINKLVKKSGKDSYTPEEIEALLDAYIEGAES